MVVLTKNAKKSTYAWGFFLFTEVFTLIILQKILTVGWEKLKLKRFPLLLHVFTINYAKYEFIGGMTPGNSWPPKYQTDMDLIVIRDYHR